MTMAPAECAVFTAWAGRARLWLAATGETMSFGGGTETERAFAGPERGARLKLIRVLALMSYPVHAAATRFRIAQYVPLLHEHGIDVEMRPFLTNEVFSTVYDRRRIRRTATGIVAGTARRIADARGMESFDVVFVQREAALVGPPLVEWFGKRQIPLVLDLDDATWIEQRSEVFGRFARWVKGSSRVKTDRLIRWSSHVVAGNAIIAAYVKGFGKPVTILPTIPDLDTYRPGNRTCHEVTVGWIGSHSTFPFVRTILPVLERLARVHRFRVRIIGGGAEACRLTIPGLPVEFVPWTLSGEVAALQSLDIGMYPIVRDAWGEAKSGLKAIQYLACGIPYVASPVGAVAHIGIPGTTHLEAESEDDWHVALARLIVSATERREMSIAGRQWAVEQYSTRRTARQLAAVIREVACQK